MPGSPCLLALSFAPDPTADQLPVVRIATQIMHIEVEESRKCQIAARRQKALGANGEAWQMRHTTKHEAGEPYTLRGIEQRKGLVVRKAIEIACQALPQPGNSIARIEGLAPISRIGISILRSNRKYTDQKRVKVCRRGGASENRGARDAEFEIRCWFEGDLFSMNERLIL